MAGETIFFTPVGAPAGALDARKNIYGTAGVRSSDAHAWLHRKMAYATANARITATGESAALNLSTGGGIQGQGLYEPGGGDAGRFNPKPHINAVKISSMGDFGSILKCELTFTVYNKSDLNEMRPFFTPGAELNTTYGWNRAGSAAGSPGNYEGVVTNFSFQVNSVGGFDCSCTAIGKGMNILSVSANPSSDAEGKEVADALGNKVLGNNALATIKVLIENKAGSGEKQVDGDGIGCVKFPDSWGSAENSGENGAGDASTASPHYYVSLEGFVKIALRKIHQAAPKLKDINIKCDGTVTKGNVPTGGSDMLVSGNPKEILLPHPYATYGPTHDLGFTTHSNVFKKGDLSKIMISYEYLTELVNGLAADKGNNAKSADISISKLFNKLFDCINQNTGTRFKLTLSQNPENPKEFLIVDANYVDTTIQPYVITAVTRDSICRSISLVSKLPSEIATAAYVGATSPATPQGAAIASINKQPEEKPAGADKDVSFTEAKKRIDATGPAPKEDPEAAGPSKSNVNLLREAIKRMYTSGEGPNGEDPTKTAYPLPFDFSCVLDGISGFVFGNAITCNYLPTAYTSTENAKICFTVTNVEQNITANDWTTTLNTVCRVQPTY
jgi:hypothetical protein